jgi:hypothetical protein
MTDRSDDERWDIHTERQLSVSKAAVTAVTVLNTGSWLALLSQVGDLRGASIGGPVGLWAFGALLGTAIWLIIYRSTILQMNHDFDRTDKKLRKELDDNITIGVWVALSSLFCFAAGAFWLWMSLIQFVAQP